MTEHIQNEQERLALKAAFKEAAAISTWTLITMLEENQQFFVTNPEEQDRANFYLHRGLDCGEKDDHRMANNYCMTYLRNTLKERPELIISHQRLIEALVHVQKLASEVIDPLWEKHQDSFSS